MMSQPFVVLFFLGVARDFVLDIELDVVFDIILDVVCNETLDVTVMCKDKFMLIWEFINNIKQSRQ